MNNTDANGFTLIELSVVLVIIALIVAGVLAGRSLISAAEIRSQISQIEKYQQAANTFRAKYGNLPGDIPEPDASNFGFTSRDTYANGDGVVTGNGVGNNASPVISCGEAGLFWRDLSQAHLIGERFSSATADPFSSTCTHISTTAITDFLPAAAIGKGNFVYVWSGGWKTRSSAPEMKSYFGLSNVINASTNMQYLNTTLTPNEAYALDKKVDDGLPQSGNVLALYANNVGKEENNNQTSYWAAGGDLGPYGQRAGGSCDPTDPVTHTGISLLGCAPITAVSGISVDPSYDMTCYDNDAVAGATPHYSITWNNGMDQNCALSFKFQ